MRQQNIEINPDTFTWYAENFQSARQAMAATVENTKAALENHPATHLFADPGQAHEFMVRSWSYIYRNAMRQLRGIFTINELYLIIDIHNGHMTSPATYGGDMIAASVADSIALDRMDDKWSVDAKQIMEKIKSLSNILSMVLELWATGFWYGKNAGENLEEYVKQLA